MTELKINVNICSDYLKKLQNQVDTYWHADPAYAKKYQARVNRLQSAINDYVNGNLTPVEKELLSAITFDQTYYGILFEPNKYFFDE